MNARAARAAPTTGITVAQSVRAAATVPAASRGYAGGKKVPGRKRHLVTDTLGLLPAVAVTAVNIGDWDTTAGPLMRLRRPHRAITLVRADGDCTGGLVGRCRDYETLPATSEAMIRWSMVTRMSGRPVRPLAVGRH